MHCDLEDWAAMWMDDLSGILPTADQWLDWCQVFLSEMLRGAGGQSLRQYVRSRYPHYSLWSALRDICHRAWTQTAPRRFALLQRLAALPPP